MAFLLFPRQTARWPGFAISARFARCPGQPFISSRSSHRALPRGRGPRGSRSPGAASRAPRWQTGSGKLLQPDGGWRVWTQPPAPHPTLVPLAMGCLLSPRRGAQGKGGALLCPRHLPGWCRAQLGSRLGCLNSVSLDGARDRNKARRQASKVPLSSADQNPNCGDPTFNSGFGDARERSHSKGLRV